MQRLTLPPPRYEDSISTKFIPIDQLHLAFLAVQKNVNFAFETVHFLLEKSTLLLPTPPLLVHT
ncbi:hypothetical protein BT69DRAFT_1278434 [Atractiella rhizophila]|nr:hypothetical protein BT69DRAFT_1278434 [Atractiella rhizophila]